MARKPKTSKADRSAKPEKAGPVSSPNKMTKAALAAEVKELRARLDAVEGTNAPDDGVDGDGSFTPAGAAIYDILESSPIGATVVLDDGTFEFANSRMAELVGMTREQFLAVHARELYVDPDERDAIGAKLRKEGRLRDVEARMRTADGRPFWILLSFEKIEDDNGGRYYGWVYDIDDQKKTTEELRLANESNALIRHIAEAANAAVTIEDAIAACLDSVAKHSNWPVGHAFRRVGVHEGLAFRSAAALHGIPQGYRKRRDRRRFRNLRPRHRSA